MLITDIATEVRDRLTTETITDARMLRLVASAVRYYSRYNPRVVRGTFVTVADQQLYALPSGAIGVIEVQYWPSGELGTTLVNDDDVGWVGDTEDTNIDLISQRVINDIKEGERIKRIRGRYWMEGDNMALSPVPADALTTVNYTYAALHPITGSTSYDTIPSDDLDIMVNLVLAEYLSGRASEISLEPDYGEGLGRVTKSGLTKNIAAVVEQLKAPLIFKYSRPVAGL